MTKNVFKQNLNEALEDKGGFVTDSEIDEFLDLNFDEDSSLAEWTYRDFADFAGCIATNDNDIWEACRTCYDLHFPDEDEYYADKVNDERSELPWDFGKHFE